MCKRLPRPHSPCNYRDLNATAALLLRAHRRTQLMSIVSVCLYVGRLLLPVAVFRVVLISCSSVGLQRAPYLTALAHDRQRIGIKD